MIWTDPRTINNEINNMLRRGGARGGGRGSIIPIRGGFGGGMGGMIGQPRRTIRDFLRREQFKPPSISPIPVPKPTYQPPQVLKDE